MLELTQRWGSQASPLMRKIFKTNASREQDHLIQHWPLGSQKAIVPVQSRCLYDSLAADESLFAKQTLVDCPVDLRCKLALYGLRINQAALHAFKASLYVVCRLQMRRQQIQGRRWNGKLINKRAIAILP